MLSQSILQELKDHLTDFSPAGAAAVASALAQASHHCFDDPVHVIEFHELVLFLRAYPASREILRLTESLLRNFSSRVRQVDSTLLEDAEVSGIAGSGLTAVFTASTAAYLASRHAADVRIAWDAWDTPQRLGLVLQPSVPLLADDAEVEPRPPYQRWLGAVSGGGAKELPWLLDHVAGRFDLLELPLRWEFGDSAATRTRMQLARHPVFFHNTPLIARREIDLNAVTTAESLPARRMDPAEGRRMLDLTRETLAVRYRELHGFLWGDPSSVVEVDAGRGVRFFFSNVVTEHRLPLRSYLGATIWKNGVPIGYFEGLSFFERMEAGFNLFYTFRAGETAWIYRQLLTACHQLAGVRCFLLDPYQIGHENPEGIDSGAFWFYRKLGYRSVDSELRDLTAREERRLASNPRYRTSAAILRRLAARAVIFETVGCETGAWDRFELRNLGFAVGRAAARKFAGDTARMKQQAMKDVTRAAHFSTRSWAQSERCAFAEIAPLLALVPSLAKWTGPEHRLLEKIIRAKAGPDENHHLRLTQQHASLRAALLRLGTTGVK